MVHQAISESGKVGGQLEEAEGQDPLVSRARRDEIWNLWARRDNLMVLL